MSFWRKMIRRLFRKPRFEQLLVVTRTIDGSLPTLQAQTPFDFMVLPPDVEKIEVSLAHIPAIHRNDIERRVYNGDMCCVATHKKQIMYAAWTAFGKCYSYALDREYELADDESYLYGAYTVPAFRRKGIHPAMSCHRLKLLKERGYKRELAFIEPENTAAMRMPEKLGYDKVGVTGFIEAFGFRWYFHRDQGIFKVLENRTCWRKV